MLFRLFCLLMLSYLHFVARGQQAILLEPSNADCYNAIEMIGDTFGPTTTPKGAGQIMEINADRNSLISFDKEHNSVWYKFTIPNNCVLEMDIVPLSPKDDYDFILYKYTDDNFCEEVMTKNILPVRTNISKSSEINNGKTGLSIYAADTFVKSGPGATYSRAVEVEKEEVYYLVLDNYRENGKGHTVFLKYKYCSNPKRYTIDPSGKVQQNLSFEMEIDNPALDAKKPKIDMKLTVVDKQTNMPLKATIDVLNAKSQNLVGPDYHLENATTCTKKLVQNRKYVIQVAANGYFPAAKEILAKTENIILTASLQKIELGKNIIIDDIFFYGNTEKFLSNSFPTLKSLVKVLYENPKLKIKIQGHVNWPKKFASDMEAKFNMDLSWNRAKAVYDYLVKAGIEPKRLDFEGYSNTKMIYPHPSNEDESQKNRRVEIEVIDY